MLSMTETAIGWHEWLLSYMAAGFTRDEAMQLVNTQVAIATQMSHFQFRAQGSS